MLCDSLEDLDTQIFPRFISELETVGCEPILPPDHKEKKKDQSYSGDVMNRYLFKKTKISKA